MRRAHHRGGLTVHAVAGTHTVLLGFDLADPHRLPRLRRSAAPTTPRTRRYWLRGLKTFASLVPHPSPGMDFSLRDHPVQGFQWGDYTAKPDHEYTYDVVAWTGAAAALVPLPGRRSGCGPSPRTTACTASGSTAASRGPRRSPSGSGTAARRPARTRPIRRSRGSPAGSPRRSSRSSAGRTARTGDCAGRSTSSPGAAGCSRPAAAAAAGADVALVVHGRDKDSAAATAAGKDADRTAADNRAAVAAAGLDAVVTWRTAPSRSRRCSTTSSSC